MKIKKNQPLQPLDRRAAGIDIGSDMHFVAVPDDIEESVRSFETFTTGLHELVRWLKACAEPVEVNAASPR